MKTQYLVRKHFFWHHKRSEVPRKAAGEWVRKACVLHVLCCKPCVPNCETPPLTSRARSAWSFEKRFSSVKIKFSEGRAIFFLWIKILDFLYVAWSTMLRFWEISFGLIFLRIFLCCTYRYMEMRCCTTIRRNIFKKILKLADVAHLY